MVSQVWSPWTHNLKTDGEITNFLPSYHVFSVYILYCKKGQSYTYSQTVNTVNPFSCETSNMYTYFQRHDAKWDKRKAISDIRAPSDSGCLLMPCDLVYDP